LFILLSIHYEAVEEESLPLCIFDIAIMNLLDECEFIIDFNNFLKDKLQKANFIPLIAIFFAGAHPRGPPGAPCRFADIQDDY
jgi:hypothetical protein